MKNFSRDTPVGSRWFLVSEDISFSAINVNNARNACPQGTNWEQSAGKLFSSVMGQEFFFGERNS